MNLLLRIYPKFILHFFELYFIL
jgi:hypothetical protein